ncbi:hypothetical protein BOTNAR_0193g00200 [Botryotinia narcissicola]|uniref:Uncharacterized protein n=1 Tax=Botryotinia narcissicola TaxID=278944 RepID=A0A4Z1I977_9HELO|nr:hypothetical protein BOTNAR_0193g00200 [Botryotinia narcissicola]
MTKVSFVRANISRASIRRRYSRASDISPESKEITIWHIVQRTDEDSDGIGNCPVIGYFVDVEKKEGKWVRRGQQSDALVGSEITQYSNYEVNAPTPVTR